jgi:hypothetical protein
MITVSETQARVLREMVETGLSLKFATGAIGSVWVTTLLAENSKYRVTTLFALVDKKLIERCDTEKTPWYRRDYILTKEGRRIVE